MYGLVGIGIALGVAAVVRGYYGTRTGADPSCRRCGYNLTAAVSDRCSECGLALSQDNIVTGVRRRRPGFIMVGCLLIACAITTLIPAVRNISPYHYMSFSWLTARVDCGEARAADELYRRIQCGALSEEQLYVLAEISLNHREAKTIASAVRQEWVNILEVLSAGGYLSKEQEERYADGLVVDVTIRIPDEVSAGSRLTIDISFEKRITVRGMGCEIMEQRLSVGERHFDPEDCFGAQYYPGGVAMCKASFGTEIDTGVPVGEHVVEYIALVCVFRGQKSTYTTEIRESRVVTVVP